MDAEARTTDSAPASERRGGSLLPPDTAPARADLGGQATAASGLEPRRHDFRAPSFLDAGQWRKLRQEHERYAETLGTRLSNYLRLDVPLRLARFEILNWDQFVSGAPEASHFCWFTTEPAHGLSVLEIPPQLALAMVDRVLGGAGESAAGERGLSELEVALLDQIVLLILGEWCRLWASQAELRPAILGHETSGRFLPPDQRNAQVLIFSLKAKVAACLEEMTFVIPGAMLEALLPKDATQTAVAAHGHPAKPSATPAWHARFNRISVALVAQWPERLLTARQVAQLKIGDVLEWEPADSADVRLLLANTVRFTGRLGTRNGKWAVEITGRRSPSPA